MEVFSEPRASSTGPPQAGSKILLEMVVQSGIIMKRNIMEETCILKSASDPGFEFSA